MLRCALITIVLMLSACHSKTASDNAADDYANKMAREHRDDRPTPSPATTTQPSAPIRSQMVKYGTVRGHDINGYLAYPASAEGGLPAVLVFHEWWGLNDNIKAMANQLAGQGYVALAADLYGGKVADKPDAAHALMEAALKDDDAIAQNIRQAHAYLKDQIKATRVGAIGWCFGGGQSLRTALLVPDQVDAAVVYYGFVGAFSPDDLKVLKAPVLGFFGGADQSIPVDAVHAFEQTLKSEGKNVEVHIYDGAGHAFANPSGGNYKAEAATDAWQRSLAFLAEHLKGD